MDLNAYDKILHLLSTDRVNGFTLSRIIEVTGVSNAKEILFQMESNNLVGVLMRRDGDLDYLITADGLGIVVRPGGYDDFVREIIQEHDERKHREDLELRKLTHEVSISKIQFWFLVIGSATGFISFILTIWSFIKD